MFAGLERLVTTYPSVERIYSPATYLVGVMGSFPTDPLSQP